MKVSLLLAVAVSVLTSTLVQAQGALVKVDGSSTVYPVTEAVAEDFQKSERGAIKVTVGISGTGGGFKKFCRGEIDVGNASRPILKSEMAECAKAGIEYFELPVAFDDYVTKPFSPRELKARIKAVLRRRAPEAAQEMLCVGPVSLDPVTHRVTANGRAVALGPTEFRLLRFLLARPERVHSRTQLLDQVWGDHVYIEERTVDVHIRRLRLALEPFGVAALIETVRGSGYRLSVPR